MPVSLPDEPQPALESRPGRRRRSVRSLDRTKKQLIELLGNADSKVIALSGRWGTGKTHLWSEVKAESEKSEIKKALYVSLFGLSSIDQVKRKLMEGALPDAAVGGDRQSVV